MSAFSKGRALRESRLWLHPDFILCRESRFQPGSCSYGRLRRRFLDQGQAATKGRLRPRVGCQANCCTHAASLDQHLTRRLRAAAKSSRDGRKSCGLSSHTASPSSRKGHHRWVTTRCARQIWRNPTGESPVRVRRSEPPHPWPQRFAPRRDDDGAEAILRIGGG
jgi:hypothetical protein